MSIFSLVQFTSTVKAVPATTIDIHWNSFPTIGNLCCLAGFIGAGLISIQDGLGNKYTPSTNSPFSTPATPSSPETDNILAYLIVPSPRDSIITVTWTTPRDFATVFLAEFSFTSASVAYDKDAVQTTTQAVGTSLSLPTITPSFNNSLLFAYCNPDDNVVAPTAGSPAGVWTGLNIEALTGIAAEYCLDASLTTPINFTDDTSGGFYRAMSMAFSPVPGTRATSTSILRGPHRGSRMTPPYNP